MTVLTPVIGIPNWDWKKKLLLHAEKHPNIHVLDIRDFCHECQRHFEILQYFEKDKSSYNQTKYYIYQKHQNRQHTNIIRRIEKFKSLYKSIRKKGCKEPPIVTDDGCRLNGSHRLAILIYLNVASAKINVAIYEDVLSSKESRKIRKSVQEYRSQQYSL